MDDYASKPVDPKTLKILLDRYPADPAASKSIGGDGAAKPSSPPPSLATD